MNPAHQTVRGIYLTGSWPCDGYRIDPDAAGQETVAPLMKEPLALAAGHLAYLGDGEPWRGYMIYIPESLKHEPALKVARTGGWTSIRDRTVIARRRPWCRLPALDPHLRYSRFAERSMPVLARLRQEYRARDLALLAGIPSPLTVSVLTFGIPGPLGCHRAVRRATAREIASIGRLGRDAVIQLELCAETIAMCTMPGAAQPAAARLLAVSTLKLARQIPPGTRIALHLCFGALRGKSQVTPPPSLAPLVSLVNALTARWPEDQPLEVVHLPLVALRTGISLDPAYYAPLRRLRLPRGTQLALGFVTSDQTEEELHAIFRLARQAVPGGPPLRVAPPCGLRDETPDSARKVVERAVSIADAAAREGQRGDGA